ncbi:MAG TPA: CDP-alcohol phosphatidyltransferase family protein [Thermoanaerobaculia bacterium]|nr:CDP-alcohol phosphatidyltransferase family protein [Thermoanaerobaculia bacterium]
MNAWRERTSRWLRPIAVRTPLSPNALTILAVGFSLAAAVSLFLAPADPNRFLHAVGLFAVGGALDLLDGAVARAQGKTSRFGDFLDHFLDRVSDLAVTAGWIIGSGSRLAIGLPALVAIMLNGYIGTQIEATFRTRTYEATGRAEFVLAMITFPIIAWILAVSETSRASLLGLTTVDWLTLLLGLFALVGIAQRLREARRLSGAA